MNLCLRTFAMGSSSDRVSTVSALLAMAVLMMLTAPAAAQLQFGELAKRALPAIEDDTKARAVGDVGGDGDPVMVVGNGFNAPAQSRLYLVWGLRQRAYR